MIMNSGGGGGRVVMPFPSCGVSTVVRETAACGAPSCCLVPVLWPTLSPTSSPSSVDHTIVCRQPSHCCHPHCFPPPSTPLLSAIDIHIVIAHVVITNVVVCLCLHGRCHDRRFRCYPCCFLADCFPWTLPGALPATPPPLFVMPFDDVVLPPWVLALDNVDSH